MTVRPAPRTPGRTMVSRAKWFLRARPGDYMLAASDAMTSLPVVGRHLEPLGGLTAMSIWGTRLAPGFVSASAKAWLSPGVGELKKAQRDQTRTVSDAALRGIVSGKDLDIEWPAPDRTPPFWRARHHRRHLHRTSVRYGKHPVQLLDVWRRKDLPVRPAPVLIFVPGGAWVHGGRQLQGYALMSHLAEMGWVCLSVQYRVSPHNRWPSHITDVKTAIAWARANVDKFGGDRSFIAVAGCSAGGHLAALAGLTPDDPQHASKLPDGADSSVDAVIGVYGRYDWEDRSTRERAQFVEFLERVVVKRRIVRHPEVFRDASPIARVERNAPPFLVIHGSKDSVIPVEQARSFVERMRAVSGSMVGYLELPGAGHGFDLVDGERAGVAAHATSLFLNQVYRTATQIRAKEVI